MTEENNDHFHIIRYSNSDPDVADDKVYIGDFPRFIELAEAEVDHTLVRQEQKLWVLADDGGEGDDALLAKVTRRVAQLRLLSQMLDPRLFEHALFGRHDARTALIQSLQNLVDDEMDPVQLTEDAYASFNFCTDPPEKCPGFAEVKATMGRADQRKEMRDLFRKAGIPVEEVK